MENDSLPKMGILYPTHALSKWGLGWELGIGNEMRAGTEMEKALPSHSVDIPSCIYDIQ